MSNTHTEILKLGESMAIISGVIDSCDHKWDGAAYYITKSGKYIDYKTHKEWVSYVDSFRQKLIFERYKNIDDEIVESGVTCSICNKPYQPEFF